MITQTNDGADTNSRNSGNPRRSAPREGKVARAIEKQTAKVPSDTFLWLAGGAVAASLLLRLAGKKDASVFVGEWVPSILICGVYNKIVKTQGHDRNEPVAASDTDTDNNGSYAQNSTDPVAT